MKYGHQRLYEEFLGLDLRSSEETRPRKFSRRFENLMHLPQGAMQQRYGTQVRTKLDNIGCQGVWPFQATDMLQNERDYILGAGSDTLAKNHNLYRRVSNTATFTNSHATLAATVSMYYDSATTQFRFKIVRGGVSILDQAIGDGLGSTYTLASLITAVNGVASCNLAASGATTGQACFIEIADDQVVAAVSGTLVLTYYTWTEVNRPVVRYPVASVSVGNDTLTLTKNILEGADAASGNGRANPQPFKDGDAVFILVGTGSVIPTGFTAGTTYFVRDANLSTIKLAATSGGAAINITGAGSGVNVFVCSSVVNPYATFANYALELGQSSFRPCSSVPLRNVRYFAPGNTGTNYYKTAALAKYDGQSFYRAGLPLGPRLASTTIPPAATSSDVKGSLARSDVTWVGASIYYRFQYRFVDKAGNIIDGELSPEYDSSNAGDVSGYRVLSWSAFNALLPCMRGHQSDWGVVSGTTTGLTFTMTDGYGNNNSTMRAGDIAYFYDSRQTRFIQREVTAGTGSSMTIAATSLDLDPTSPSYDDGDTPTVLDGAAVSANLRVVVWRAKTSAANSPKYLVEEIPWNPSYLSYIDDKADAALGATLIEPAYPASPPPAGRFLATFNEQLIITGFDKKDRTVYFEDIETPEGCPAGTHEFDLPLKAVGARQSGPVLICTTKTSVHEVAGDLSEFKFKVDQIGQGVGCLSHASMQELEEGVLVFESAKGPYVLYAGRRLEPLGAIKMDDNNVSSRLEPYFTADYSATSPRPVFERATSVLMPLNRWYVLFIPLESTVVPTFSAQSQVLGEGSVCFVYDYGRGAWYRWLGVDFSNACEKDNVLHFCTRKYDGSGSAIYSDVLGYYGTMLTTKGKYNYCDHATPTVWTFQPHWEALGQPAILKKALRCRISSSGRGASSTIHDLNTYVDYDTASQSTDDTLTWGTQRNLKPKLKSESIRSILIEFTGSRCYEPMPISGYELEMVAPFREVFKE